jgi:hypothetical protein
MKYKGEIRNSNLFRRIIIQQKTPEREHEGNGITFLK